jgi:hypothetical protein
VIQVNAQTLSYAVPVVFFEGTCRYRTPRALFAAGISAAMAVGFGAVAASVRAGVGAMLAGEAAAGLIVFAAFLLYSYARNRQIAVRITEDGVERGRTLWAWANIATIYGEITTWPAGVVPYVRLRGSVAIDRPLETDPALTEGEFAGLMGRLAEFTGKCHPHVKVEVQPRAPAGA